MGDTGDCLDKALEACNAALETLGYLREALGKHRGKGGGMARLLRDAALALQEAVEPCIHGCLLPQPGEKHAAIRCSLGAALEEAVRTLNSLAVRLEHVPRLRGDSVEEQLAKLLVDAAAGLVETVYAAAREAARLLAAEG